MSDPENKIPSEKKGVLLAVPLHMVSNPCGPFTVISAAAPGLVISITVSPQIWPPKELQKLLEAIAPALGSPGEQPKDSANTSWAEKPKADA